MVEISCIMPTYNRSKIITATLESLKLQTFGDQFEIVIVDDGSFDETNAVVNNYIEANRDDRISWKYIYQENKGPAAARNNGIRNAQGKYILFLGDDMVAESDLINKHINLLRTGSNICSLGVVKWHPFSKNKDAVAFRISGVEINYERIPNPGNCDFTYFCTANIALPKVYLLEDLFDESFIYAAMEDTELGYRLAKKGLRISLNKEAVVLHWHHYEEKDIISRQEKIGKSVAILVRKYPELRSRLIKSNSRIILLFCRILMKFKFIRLINKDFYWIVLATYAKYKYCT